MKVENNVLPSLFNILECCKVHFEENFTVIFRVYKNSLEYFTLEQIR